MTDEQFAEIKARLDKIAEETTTASGRLGTIQLVVVLSFLVALVAGFVVYHFESKRAAAVERMGL